MILRDLYTLWKMKQVPRRWRDKFMTMQQVEAYLPLIRDFAKERSTYAAMPGAEKLHDEDDLPCVQDRMNYTPIDAHYIYQCVWAAQRIKELGVEHHIDIGSLALYVGMLTAFTEVEVVDIRPLTLNLEGFTSRSASILELPYADQSVKSISSLSVIEHIGLGRYGDPLDPQGAVKALRELTRVVAVGGTLWVSFPVGRPRVQYNAHRILDPLNMLEHMQPLRLAEFSVIDDEGRYCRDVDPADHVDNKYTCGLFEMTRDSAKV